MKLSVGRWILLIIPIWVVLMVFVIVRSPGDVAVVYKKMTGLIPDVYKINGNALMDDRSLKWGAGLIMMEFSSSSWSEGVKEMNEKLFQSVGASKIEDEKTILYCKGREQYDLIPPGLNGSGIFQIIMAYPGGKCG
ncbi:hypothetical protein [Achromobacter insolitus]|uniref:hypothetical protein n=1 Tax=Achromobacter insolitus TaxID=217204 RepID=UPI00241DDDF7|nr:hypothetical protein [Achromobacter insolitus]